MTAGPVRLSRRHALALMAAAALPVPARAAAAATATARVAAIDWAALETLLMLGMAPVAATELRQFRRIAIEPELPGGVADLGLRGAPNYEMLRIAAPDLILSSNYYEAQRANLERIAPVLSLPVYLPGEPPYPRAVAAALELGRRLGRENLAAAAVAAAEAEIAGHAGTLRPLAGRPAYVVNFGDPRHVRAFGADSLFGDVLTRLGLHNAWSADTRYAAMAPVGFEVLARVPEAVVAIVEPTPPEVRWALADSALWNALPMVRGGRVVTLPPVNHFGGLPAARRFARQFTAALTGAGIADG
ncbi:ABC transporter substrate-binding protein [Azospirillum sp. ST 5-10]|uniref:ABC transporter substrate-binding protein n=1 Tax=unclassified Azospirillum TaxID=2630922 RepID=UPI003F49CF4E